MASRTRNRVLGIVVLLLAAAVTILVILLSQSGEGPRVTPLREDKAKHEQRNDREEEAGPSARWFTPAPLRSDAQARRSARKRSRERARKRAHSERRGRRTARTPVKKRERTRRARSKDRRPPRDRAPSTPPFVGPVPVSAPTPPPPAAAAEPVPSQPAGTPPKSEPKTEALEARAVEVEIEDGDLEDELENVHPSGGQVRLRVRSDQLVLFEVEDRELSRFVPAGGDALIEFPSTKSYEVELRRRKGVLILRLSD